LVDVNGTGPRPVSIAAIFFGTGNPVFLVGFQVEVVGSDTRAPERLKCLALVVKGSTGFGESNTADSSRTIVLITRLSLDLPGARRLTSHRFLPPSHDTVRSSGVLRRSWPQLRTAHPKRAFNPRHIAGAVLYRHSQFPLRQIGNRLRQFQLPDAL